MPQDRLSETKKARDNAFSLGTGWPRPPRAWQAVAQTNAARRKIIHVRHLGFVILSSFVLRHSSFGMAAE
jgi:hypothetical protein